MSKKLSISEQCRRAGIDRKTYYDRLRKGKTDLFAPVKPRKKRPFITPETAELLEKNGISKKMYYNRISKGWNEFEAANVLPNSHIYYYYKGKTVSSQLSRGKYWYFINLVNNKGLSVEEAFKHVTRNAN